MADGFEVFDWGKQTEELLCGDSRAPIANLPGGRTFFLLDRSKQHEMLDEIKRARLFNIEEVRTLLSRACGRPIRSLNELYDVEFHKVLQAIHREGRRRKTLRDMA